MKRISTIEEISSTDSIDELLNLGYEIHVESKYDNGSYMIEKAEDEKQIETTINFDTTKVQRSIDLLSGAVKQLLEENKPKDPHVRIEFDDIRGMPDVWIDGVNIGLSNDKPLVSLNIDWNTDTETENHKGFDINYQDLTGERPMSRGFHEGSVM